MVGSYGGVVFYERGTLEDHDTQTLEQVVEMLVQSRGEAQAAFRAALRLSFPKVPTKLN